MIFITHTCKKQQGHIKIPLWCQWNLIFFSHLFPSSTFFGQPFPGSIFLQWRWVCVSSDSLWKVCENVPVKMHRNMTDRFIDQFDNVPINGLNRARNPEGNLHYTLRNLTKIIWTMLPLSKQQNSGYCPSMRANTNLDNASTPPTPKNKSTLIQAAVIKSLLS